jgi:monoterpene epsilon-lactone hydrolase
MPSRTHDLLARVVPRVRRSRELDSEPAERARVERWHATLDRSFPTALVPRFSRRFSLLTEELAGFPVQVMTPRHV